MLKHVDPVQILDMIRILPFKKVKKFGDIAPLLASPQGRKAVTDALEAEWAGKIDAVAGLDARGFVFGTSLADRLELPFIMIRKVNKLPGKVVRVKYALEYGTDVIEMQKDALPKGARVLIVDDVLATGGTAAAAARLTKKVGAVVVGFAFVIELPFLKGRKKLGKAPIQSLVTL